jgi:hypothetical protein
MQKDWNEMVSSFQKDTYLEMHEYNGEDEVVIAEIDNKDMSKVPSNIRSAVRGYPTILELQHGDIKNEYRGDRSHNDLYIWILINADPKEKAQNKPQTKSAPKPQVRPAPKPQIKPAPKPQIKPAPKPQIKPAPKPQVRPMPQPMAQPIIQPAPQQALTPRPRRQTLQQRFSMEGNQFYW